MAYVKGADPGVIQATVVGGSEPSYQPVVAQPVISQPVIAQPQPVAQPASTMMSITVPAGCGPGSILQIQGPNGPLNITVPPNVGPGATLQVDTGGAPAPAPAPAPVMAAPANTMSVTVPAGVGPGSVLQVAGPNGPINITVPPGIAPGTVLQVQVPPATHFNTQVNGPGGRGHYVNVRYCGIVSILVSIFLVPVCCCPLDTRQVWVPEGKPDPPLTTGCC
mmetsp:Transcript_10855/g.25231  ORF Transcript_10855/g.25231 Transcript_10855/m.25231 type:complete len:221 (-) Transcript_10855:143-805(-)